MTRKSNEAYSAYWKDFVKFNLCKGNSAPIMLNPI